MIIEMVYVVSVIAISIFITLKLIKYIDKKFEGYK